MATKKATAQTIKTFADACKVVKLDPKKCLPDTSNSAQEDAKALIAQAKLFIITRALNDGWTPNWKDSNEAKYYPWWDMEAGFVLYYVDCSYSGTAVGSRLCFKSRELVEFAAKTFKKEYKDLFVIS